MKIRIILLTLALLLCFGASAQELFDRTAAENLALEAAGIPRERALLSPTEIETEHGQSVYDVEFQCDGLEYEYWIRVTDGAIVKRAWDLTSEKTFSLSRYQDAQAPLLGESAALASALAEAELREDQVTLLEITLDTDDSLRLYEVVFYTQTAEYEIDVDAVSGAICGVSIEYFDENDPVRPGGQRPGAGDSAQGQIISSDSARAAALRDAGLSASDVTFTKTKLEREDGVLVYEVEFVTADGEYEYEIDAASGSIRERSLEPRVTERPAQSASYIGVDQAKSAALRHAGLSASDVTFTKAKLEKENGVRIYEIEFRTASAEYEYEINASTGAILDCDVEREDRDDDHDGDHDDDDHDDDDDDDDDD